jgi:hypothetical protein
MIACGTQEELTQQIGEHRTLQISFVENEVDGEISQSVAALPEVLSASLQENQLVALVEQPNEALGPVVQLLSRMNLTIRSVEIQEPNFGRRLPAADWPRFARLGICREKKLSKSHLKTCGLLSAIRSA